MAMAVVSSADMRADTDATDMDADAENFGAGGSATEQGEGEKRGDERFHETIFLQMERSNGNAHLSVIVSKPYRRSRRPIWAAAT